MRVLSPKDRYRVAQRITILSVLLNVVLSIVKILVGILGLSPALIADGIHSLSDLLSDFLILIAAHYGSLEADENHPYGHRRVETFATLMIGLFLMTIGSLIGYEGVVRIMHHASQRPDVWALIVAIASVLVNEVRYHYMRRAAKKIDSDMLYANADHSRSDSWASLVVGVGILGAMLGWTFFDAVAAILVGLLIVKMGVKWFAKASYELSDGGVSPLELDSIAKTIQQVPDVLHLHHLRTRKMGAQVFCDVHVEVSPKITVSEGHFISHTVRLRLMESHPMVADVTVHVDVEDMKDRRNRLPDRSHICRAIDPIIETWIPADEIRDLRIHYLGDYLALEWVVSWDGCRPLGAFLAASPEGSLDAFEEKLLKAVQGVLPSVREVRVLLASRRFESSVGRI